MPDQYRTATAGGRTKTTRTLVTAVFLAAVAGFESVGFRLSYQALHRVAVDNGVSEHSAWMFPVLVDGGIVLGSIGVVRALAAQRATRPYWVVVIGFTLVSWGFNVSNAPADLGGWAVATVAPLAQMVALELGMQELRALLLPQPAVGRVAEEPPPAAPAPAPTPLPPPAPAATAVLPVPQPPAAEPPAAGSADQQPEQQQPDPEEQHPESEQQDQQSLFEPEPCEQQQEQRQQRQRPVLAPDDSRPWAVLYEECGTEEERIALTRSALADRPKLIAPQWAVDIGKSETRGRDLLRAARKQLPEPSTV